MAAVTLDSKRRSPGRTDAQPTPIRAHRRSGLTLVEMMVSVTITLLVVFAIVQVFDIMGQTVAMGRATIEMAGQLRSVTNTLQRDLDNLTCPVEPWIDPDAGLGYFEYIEGMVASNGFPSTDFDADGDNALDADRTLDTDGVFGVLGASHFGDVDDALFFTVRSEGEPFTGKFVYYTNGATIVSAPYDQNGQVAGGLTRNEVNLESNVAEVVWWVGVDANGVRSLHRRVLLVYPSLNGANLGGATLPAGLVSGNMTFTNFTPKYLQTFHQESDVSVRVVTDTTGKAVGLAANSLGDLTTPSNRFAHYAASNNLGSAPGLKSWLAAPTANEIDGTRGFGEAPTTPDFQDSWGYPVDNRYLAAHIRPPTNTNRTDDVSLVLDGNRLGEDVLLSDVIAFDVRIYDEDAPLFAAGNVVLGPSDAGWAALTGGTPVGTGAFTDLSYGTAAGVNPAAVTGNLLAAAPSTPTDGGASTWISYDTWTLAYERDGVDQDGTAGTDQGFNGLDDLISPPFPVNGIDDISERETQPPYNVPLSGIEVRIRMLEFGTGQVRQASVVGDFSN